jgi:hypothetical protein
MGVTVEIEIDEMGNRVESRHRLTRRASLGSPASIFLSDRAGVHGPRSRSQNPRKSFDWRLPFREDQPRDLHDA